MSVWSRFQENIGVAPVEETPEKKQKEKVKAADQEAKTEEVKADETEGAEQEPKVAAASEPDKDLDAKAEEIIEGAEKAAKAESQAPKPKAPVLRDTPVTTDKAPREGRDTMRSMEFYETVGNEIFDYDRGQGLGENLRGWMKSAFPDDPDLAQDFVTRVLPEILKKNPELIDTIKEVAKKAETQNMPYSIKWVETGDHSHEFASYTEAAQWEHDTYASKVNNFQERMFLTKLYLKKLPDGKLVEVSKQEVVDFYNSYDGDREQMLRDLEMKVKEDQPAEPKKGKKSKGAKSDKDEAA